MDFNELKEYTSGKGCTIVGEPKLVDVKVQFEINGENCIIFFDKNARIRNGKVVFNGDNGVVFFGNSNIHSDIEIGENSTVFIGDNCYFHPRERMKIQATSDTAILIGCNTLSSLGISLETLKKGDSILVGEHSWLTHGITLKGNCNLAPNTIIASMSDLTDLTTQANSCYGGSGEAKLLMDNVLFSTASLRKMGRSEREDREILPVESVKQLISINGELLVDTMHRLREAENSAERLRILLNVERKSIKYFPVKKQDKKKERQRANKIKGKYEDIDNKSKIKFEGHGNRVVFEKGVKLHSCVINFTGDNGLVYIKKGSEPYKLSMSVNSDSTVYLGCNNSFTQNGTPLNINVSEGECAIIGNDNSFGNHIWCRTSDQHAIYDIKTRRRINPAASVVIGDRTTIGNDAVIMKGVVTANGMIYEDGSFLIRTSKDIVNNYKDWPSLINRELNTWKRSRVIKKLSKNR